MSKTPMVVFRVSKLKSAGQINAAHSHNIRSRKTINSNSKIENVIVKSCENAYATVIKTIGKQTIRKNAVLSMEVIISASPQYFRPSNPERFGYWEDEKLQAWRRVMEPWIQEKFPYAVSVALHLDECTPHYHIVDIPLDEKGKLSARNKYGGDSKQDIKRWQDWASEPVKGLGIARGVDGSTATHERIQNYYAKTNAITPLLAKLPQPEPPPLIRRTQEGLIKYAMCEREKVYKSIKPTYLALAAKAKCADLAIQQKDAAIATSLKLSAEKNNLKKSADLLRELPIDDVLKKLYGAMLVKGSKLNDDSRKWRLNDEREVAVSAGKNGADVWVEQGGKGQRGAINLVMHLERLDYKDAVRLLAEHYDASAITAERTAQLSRQVKAEIEEIIQQPLKPPLPVPENWKRVRQYLVEIRALPEMFVDWMYMQRKIYADSKNNAVFPRERGGAFIRGTTDKKYFRTLGNKNQGAYVIEGVGDVWLCESSIDALSIKAHSPDAHVISVSGNLIKLTELTIPIGRKIISAFDNDHQGKNFTEEAIKLWPAIQIMKPPTGKDWNAALQNDDRLIDAKWLMNTTPEKISAHKLKLSM